MSKKHTYEYVKTQIETVGYELLSPVYINNKAKIKIQCNKGHVYEAATGNFLAGQRCPVCAGKQQHTYDYIKEQLEKEGYKLLSNEYKNNKTKLKLQCPKGHIWYVRWDIFLAGNRCLICSGKKKHTYEYVKNQIETVGYKLLSKKYENTTKKIKVQCPKGHIYNVKFGNWLHLKHRCPYCIYADSKSKQEKELFEIIKSFTFETVIENDRTQILNPKTRRYLELDILIPNLNKAIEFNGEYWHASDYSKYKDKQKVIQCKNKNIDLLIIWYKDWINNKTVCINILKTFLQV